MVRIPFQVAETLAWWYYKSDTYELLRQTITLWRTQAVAQQQERQRCDLPDTDSEPPTLVDSSSDDDVAARHVRGSGGESGVESDSSDSSFVWSDVLPVLVAKANGLILATRGASSSTTPFPPPMHQRGPGYRAKSNRERQRERRKLRRERQERR